ncbi:hypothetical protein LCGC14_2365690, partial [marine sediment metagenome]
PEEPVEPSAGIPSWVWIIVGVAVIGLAGYVFWWRRRIYY